MDSLPVASSVSGAGSFAKAFSAARHEVGPGGVFRWNGNVYSTYTSEEWAKLSPEQQAEFADRVSEVEFEPEAVPAHHEPVVAEAIIDAEPSYDGADDVLGAGDFGSEIPDSSDDILVDASEDVHDEPLVDDGFGVGQDFDGDQMDDAGIQGDF
jgi:hypothetical protein